MIAWDDLQTVALKVSSGEPANLRAPATEISTKFLEGGDYALMEGYPPGEVLMHGGKFRLEIHGKRYGLVAPVIEDSLTMLPGCPPFHRLTFKPA